MKKQIDIIMINGNSYELEEIDYNYHGFRPFLKIGDKRYIGQLLNTKNDKCYEIISYVNESGAVIYPYQLHDSRNFSYEDYFGIESIGKLNMFSLKRSDGQVFTIGDEIMGEGNSGNFGKIKSFTLIASNLILVQCDMAILDFNNLQKVKERITLFTQEQKEEIFLIIENYFSIPLKNKI